MLTKYFSYRFLLFLLIVFHDSNIIITRNYQIMKLTRFTLSSPFILWIIECLFSFVKLWLIAGFQIFTIR